MLFLHYVNFNINYFVILYSFLKITLILTDDVFDIISYINLGHNLIMLYFQNSMYDCICFLIEFFIGLTALTAAKTLTINQKILSWISILPTLSIWLIMGVIFTFYHMHGYYYYTKGYSGSKKIINCIELDKKTQCSICLENIQKKGYHICNNKHYFHQDCIQKWIDTKKYNLSCPYCRQ